MRVHRPIKIISLPTEDLTHVCIGKNTKEIVFNPEKLEGHDSWIFHHLYVTTEDNIKEGDWCIYQNRVIVKIIKAFSEDTFISSVGTHCLKTLLKKVIATTDKSLLTCNGVKRFGESCNYNNNCNYPTCRLPTIHKQIIQEYCKREGDLGNVEMLYENCGSKPKIKSDNTIDMQWIKTDKLYSENDIINALHKLEIKDNKNYTHIWNGIKQNL